VTISAVPLTTLTVAAGDVRVVSNIIRTLVGGAL
jgi:hypothetical protein